MADPNRFSGPKWRIGSAAAGVVGALGYLAQIIVGFHIPSWLQIVIAAIGTLLIFFSIAIPQWQVQLEDRRRKAALATANKAVADYDVQLHEALLPLSGLLGQLLAQSNDHDYHVNQARLKQAVVDYAVHNMKGIVPRAMFYQYREYNEEPHRQLVLDGDTWRGRRTRPRPRFASGEDAGNAALALLDTRETRFIKHADIERPPGWVNGKDYQTFIQVPVVNGTQKFGLLAVDAINPGDLAERDKRWAELLGQLLSCALAVGVEKVSDTTRSGSSTAPNGQGDRD
jgi:hypothetical protein